MRFWSEFRILFKELNFLLDYEAGKLHRAWRLGQMTPFGFWFYSTHVSRQQRARICTVIIFCLLSFNITVSETARGPVDCKADSSVTLKYVHMSAAVFAAGCSNPEQ